MAKRLRVLIADDERLSRRALRSLLEQLDQVVVVAECSDGAAALAAIQREEPDLVFLDIQMPHLSGLEVLERLDPGLDPGVIFVTAYDEHAIRAFEMRALDYVLKPVDEDRLAAAVDHARSRRRERELSRRMESLLDAAGPTGADAGPSIRRLLVRQGGRAFFVSPEEVDWIEASGNYVRLHVGKDSHLLPGTLRDLEQKLDPGQFVRIHRSTIVNLDRVRHVEPYGGSDYQVVLLDGTKLRVSRGCRDRLLRDLP